MLRAVVLAALGLVPQLHAQGRALGVKLPLESVGLYSIREDRTLGLEASFYSHTGGFFPVYSRATPIPTDSVGVALGIVYQKLVKADGPVQPFWFVSPSGSYGLSQRVDLRGSSLMLEISAGIGVAWRPLDSVALWVRQGLSLSRHMTGSDPIDDRFHRDVSKLRLVPPRALAVFMW